jgi:molecular chaperone DnaK
MLLGRLDKEHTVSDAQQLVAAAATDPDAATAADQRLRDLRAAIDEAEDELMWPDLVSHAREMLDYVRMRVDQLREDRFRHEFDQHEAAIHEAIATRAPDLLRQRMSELSRLLHRILDQTGELQVLIFSRLCDHRETMVDIVKADLLIEQGAVAVREGELAQLRTINARLRDLIAEEVPDPDPFSTIRKA